MNISAKSLRFPSREKLQTVQVFAAVAENKPAAAFQIGRCAWCTMIDTVQYEFIRQLVYEQSRINLGPSKQELVSSRLRKRLIALNLSGMDAYCDLLRSPQGEDEVMDLLDAISTNFTDFFREAHHFDFLNSTVLPAWQQDRNARRGEPFRAWSAACSSGEEPYTLSIVLAEALAGAPAEDWKILATDISTRVLKKAEQAVYRQERLKLPNADMLRRYFQKGTGSWEGYFRVKNQLREHIQFRRVNLIESSYPFTEKFNVIFCRNVMIYFDRETQEQLIPQLADRLLPGGYLFVGHSESLVGIDHGLESLKPSIYRKP
jgi:chemotaxis protein methyltransferase CheR